MGDNRWYSRGVVNNFRLRRGGFLCNAHISCLIFNLFSRLESEVITQFVIVLCSMFDSISQMGLHWHGIAAKNVCIENRAVPFGPKGTPPFSFARVHRRLNRTSHCSIPCNITLPHCSYMIYQPQRAYYSAISLGLPSTRFASILHNYWQMVRISE